MVPLHVQPLTSTCNHISHKPSSEKLMGMMALIQHLDVCTFPEASQESDSKPAAVSFICFMTRLFILQKGFENVKGISPEKYCISFGNILCGFW